MSGSERPRSDVHSVHRALDVLEAVSAAGEIGVTELADQLGLPISTVHNLLRTLGRRHYLVSSGGRYGLGPALAELQTSWDAGRSLAELLGPRIRDLASAAAGSASAVVLDGDRATVVAFDPGPADLVLNLDTRSSLNPLGLLGGRTLVAAQAPQEWIHRVTQVAGIEPEWAPDDWVRTLSQIAADGLVARGGVRGLTWGVAVPVWSRAGHPICSVACEVPAPLATDARRAELEELVSDAADRLSADLGGAAVREAVSFVAAVDAGRVDAGRVSTGGSSGPTGGSAGAGSSSDTAPRGVLCPVDELGRIDRFVPDSLASSGPTLLLVDNPLTIDHEVDVPSVLYRDTVTDWVRLMSHQHNQRDEPLVVSTTASNPTGRPAELWVRRCGVGLDAAPSVAGQRATRDFLAEESESLVATLAPGETWWDDDVLVPGQVRSGLWELRATVDRVPVPLVVATSVRRPDQDVDPVVGPVTGIRFGNLQRATFDHADRRARLAVDLTAGAQQAAFNGPARPSSPWFRPERAITGEYAPGVDVVDGGRAAVNNGNYGVRYELTVDLVTQDPTRSVGIWLHPSGGVGHHVVGLDGEVWASPLVHDRMAWLVGTVDLAQRRTVSIRLMLPGGSFGSQQLIFTPDVPA